MSLILAAMLRPFIALLLVALIARPVRMAVEQRMLESKMKTVLLLSWRV